jgi:hypothetical protein
MKSEEQTDININFNAIKGSFNIFLYDSPLTEDSTALVSATNSFIISTD